MLEHNTPVGTLTSQVPSVGWRVNGRRKGVVPKCRTKIGLFDELGETVLLWTKSEHKKLHPWISRTRTTLIYRQAVWSNRRKLGQRSDLPAFGNTLASERTASLILFQSTNTIPIGNHDMATGESIRGRQKYILISIALSFVLKSSSARVNRSICFETVT